MAAAPIPSMGIDAMRSEKCSDGCQYGDRHLLKLWGVASVSPIVHDRHTDCPVGRHHARRLSLAVRQGAEYGAVSALYSRRCRPDRHTAGNRVLRGAGDRSSCGAWRSGSRNTLREAVSELSHSVAGALAGGIVGVEVYKRMRGIRGATGGMFVGSLCVGIVVGWFGCLFAGLPDRTYGTPATLP